ncbi:PepSY-associated TM helix domain-containing protein [Aquirufa salirivi]|uniref:PepSY-associated TM helix domain-containing protein n=1 Tax=Aquirufa salirivi TaxID=3104729 RepID=A0ABW8RXM3_9BACT
MSNPNSKLKPKQSKLRRSTAEISRWLHIYLSMFSFAIVLFFSVTGLTLNHQEWLPEKSDVQEQKAKLNVAWVNPTDTVKIAKLEVVEHLRNAHGIKGQLNDFRIDDAEISVSFQGPGYTADVFIDRETGAYDVTETRMGWMAVINDLHKGRDTGKSWAWVIDISAIFMIFISATGLILLLFLKKRKSTGLIWALIGLLLSYGIYHFLT